MAMHISKAWNNCVWLQELIPWSYIQKYFDLEYYRIKPKCVTTENPQASSILERFRQAVENLVHMFNLKNNFLYKDDPWAVILADNYVGLQSTYHTTLQATPAQLMFGHDTILNNPFFTDWEAIRIPKQKLIDKNNKNEN